MSNDSPDSNAVAISRAAVLQSNRSITPSPTSTTTPLVDIDATRGTGMPSDPGTNDSTSSAMPGSHPHSIAPSGNDTSDHPDASLLGIPPELRNVIYREVLIRNFDDPRAKSESTGFIKVPPQGPLPATPALLQVCQQIRDEASSIYYEENEFQFTFHDCAADLLLRWCKHSEARRNANRTTKFYGKGNWPNLKKWMKAVFDKEVRGIELPPGYAIYADAKLQRTVHHAIEMVEAMQKQGMAWEQIEPLLEYTKKTLASNNPDWD